jgi:KaiC/GvpD/RAD55 family RecA-like ATPase
MSRVLDQTRLLFYGLQANAKTTNLLTTYAVERQTRGIEEYLVSGTFVLEMGLINRRFVRTLTVEKMRSTALAPGQYVFDILANRGIALRDQSEGASLDLRSSAG